MLPYIGVRWRYRQTDTCSRIDSKWIDDYCRLLDRSQLWLRLLSVVVLVSK